MVDAAVPEDPEPLPDSTANDVLVMLVGVVTAVIVVTITWWWVNRTNKRDAELEEAPWLEGLAAALPEDHPSKRIFEEAYDFEMSDRLKKSAESVDRMDKEPDEEKKLREEMCRLLLNRARDVVLAWLPARREMSVVQRTQQRGIISEEAYDAAVEDFETLKAERIAITKAASELRPGFPGWGNGILQQAYDELVDQAAAPPPTTDGDGDASVTGVANVASQEGLPSECILRFRVGSRVECNMGDRGYVAGVLVEAWELPYQVLLDDGTRCSAPADVDQIIRAKVDTELNTDGSAAAKKHSPLDTRCWVPRDAPARFAAGAPVMAQFNGAYCRGVIVAVRPPAQAPNPESGASRMPAIAYAIRIEPTGHGETSKVVTAPVDLDIVVRRPTADELAKKGFPEFHASEGRALNHPPRAPFDEDAPLRFNVGETVMAFMGPDRGFMRALIVGAKPKLKQQDESVITKAYALQLEQTQLAQAPQVVFAPRDDDESVRKPTTAEAKAAPLLAGVKLRFKVGDAVLAQLGAPHGFVKARVLKLKPKAPGRSPPGQPPNPKQPEVVVAYELELLGVPKNINGVPQSVFAPLDVEEYIKKDESPEAPSAPAASSESAPKSPNKTAKAKGKERAR